MRDFLARPKEGDWPYLWLDATYVKAREAGCIVPVAVTIAVGVNADGRRKVPGMAVGSSEAEPLWLDFLRPLMGLLLRHRRRRWRRMPIGRAAGSRHGADGCGDNGFPQTPRGRSIIVRAVFTK